MKKQTDTFKQLRTVMKDINEDHRQIIKTMQDRIDYLPEFIAVQREILEEKTVRRQFLLFKTFTKFRTLTKNKLLQGGCLRPPAPWQGDVFPRFITAFALRGDSWDYRKNAGLCVIFRP